MTIFEGVKGDAALFQSNALLLQRNGRESLEGLVGRIDHDADGFQRRHTEQRFRTGFAENDPPGGRLAHELEVTFIRPMFRLPPSLHTIYPNGTKFRVFHVAGFRSPGVYAWDAENAVFWLSPLQGRGRRILGP